MTTVDRAAGISRAGFASAMISLGVVGLVFRDFPLIWGTFPGGIAGGATLASVASVVALAVGIGLLIPRTAMAASLALFIYVALWWLVLKVPPVVQQPGTEVSWLECGMYGMLLTGAWTLYTVSGVRRFPGDEWGRNIARQFFGLALIPVGISHFVYVADALPMVPAWLPFHVDWVYFTGACHLAAGFGIVCTILPRLAVCLEAVMVSLFTLLVWVPAVITAPATRTNWTELWVSWAVSAAAVVVALHTPALRTFKRPTSRRRPTTPHAP
ncbi:MAG: hypothetical protein WBC97_06910 [Gemmatimonadales bacterium]